MTTPGLEIVPTDAQELHFAENIKPNAVSRLGGDMSTNNHSRVSGTSILPRLRDVLGSPFAGFVLVLIALVSTLAANALLISDGPDFMFNSLNQQQVLIPHMRITFGFLQYPALFTSRFTDDFGLLRLAYSVPMVIAPLVTLVLCWWIVRKDHPQLFIWATLGILLVNLPGQINWVATSIRTNQFFWPVLLAILVGMPNRAILPSIILVQLMTVLHPHAAAYFLAGTCAALWFAWRDPDNRKRMLSVAGAGVFAFLFRIAIPASSYEQEFGTLEYQLDMARRALEGPITYALIGVFVSALLIMLAPRFPASQTLLRAAATATLVVTGVVFLYWGFGKEGVRLSSTYRGANVVIAALMMGIAFLDATIPRPDMPNVRSGVWRRRIANVACVIFCITIAAQSLVLSREVNYVRSVIEKSSAACIPESELDDFDNSPLNNFAFPAASLMLQSRNPEHIILPDEQCARAMESGDFPVWRNLDARPVASGWFDLEPLQFSIQNENACWVSMTDYWHDREIAPDGTWAVWAKSTGTFEFLTKDAMTITFNADTRSFIPVSEVTVMLNGYQVVRVEVTDDFQQLGPVTLNLSSGVNVLSIHSSQEPQSPPADPNARWQDTRTMTFMLRSPVFTSDEDGDCRFRH